WDEDHRNGRDVRDAHRVVAGAAGDICRFRIQRRANVLNNGAQAFVHRDGRTRFNGVDRDADVASLHDRSRRIADPFFNLYHAGVVDGTHVDAHRDVARYDVGLIRFDQEPADGSYRITDIVGGPLDGVNDIACRAQRVGAAEHRHRSGMAGLAGNLDVESTLAGDRRNNPEAHARTLHHRPLLD